MVGVTFRWRNPLRILPSYGDLPTSITINPTYPGSGDEGTAMMEIVYDMAPKASLSFGGPSTSLEFIDIIDWMTTTIQCNVICDHYCPNVSRIKSIVSVRTLVLFFDSSRRKCL